MAIISPKRFQRSRFHQAEKKRQLIIFQAASEGFALPIQAVVKVIPYSETYGDPSHIGTSLTTYQNKELLVLDIGPHVFKERLTEASDASFIIIVRTTNNTQIAFPVVNAPSVRRVPLSAFTPLPADYAEQMNSRCISSLVIEPEQKPLLLLNPDWIVRSHSF